MNAIRRPLAATLLAVLACVALTTPGLARSRNVLFKLEDPLGDDHGDGRLVYPLVTDFKEGELDLLSLTARRVSGGTRFEAYFAKEIRVPERESVDDLGTSLSAVARYGFYNFNLDIYIDVDREPESGLLRMLPGRLAEVQPEFAWDRIICLTPMPNEARSRLRRLVVRDMKDTMMEESQDRLDEEALQEFKDKVPVEMDERAFFPKRIKVRNRVIEFFVPDSFLGGPADPDWAYVVVVTGSDVIQSIDLTKAPNFGRDVRERFFAVPVSPGTWQVRFGGGREKEELQPPIIDMIVPSGMRQEDLLDDYSSRQNRPAKLPGVVPAEESPDS